MIQPFVKKFDKPQHSKIQVVEKTPSLRNLKTKYGQNRTKYGLFKGKLIFVNNIKIAKNSKIVA